MALKLSWNTPSISNLGWSLSGNAGTTNGINGTTDAQDFDIRTTI